MRIVILIAGTNTPSNCAFLAHTFAEGMQSTIQDLQIDTVHLKDMEIAHFTLLHYAEDAKHEKDFLHVQQLLEQSDGFVIASPIWNFSIPAHLKNLIDRIGSFALDTQTRRNGTLKGKPFYLIYTGGAPYPAWAGMMHITLSHVVESLKYFGATNFGHHFEGKCVEGPGQFGLVVDKREETLKKMQYNGSTFAEHVRRYHETGYIPIKSTIHRTLMKMGERMMAKLF